MRRKGKDKPLLSRKRKDVEARKAFIIEAYAKNMPFKDICAATGLTYGSLKVVAHRLGCTKRGKDWIDYRRGFSVPTQMQEQYRELVYDLKIPCRDVATMLDLPVLFVASSLPPPNRRAMQ